MSEHKVKGNGPYCGKHKGQLYFYGQILERTKYDKNIIKCNDRYCTMELYRPKDKKIFKTIFNNEDREKIEKLKWGILSNGYVVGSYKNERKRIYLHIHILGKMNGFITDHINRNPLDNRKENLRFATKSQNSMNTVLDYSKSRGVSYIRGLKKWRAYIGLNGKQIWLGSYKNKDEAVKARQKGEIKYFGEFNSYISSKEELFHLKMQGEHEAVYEQ